MFRNTYLHIIRKRSLLGWSTTNAHQLIALRLIIMGKSANEEQVDYTLDDFASDAFLQPNTLRNCSQYGRRIVNSDYVYKYTCTTLPTCYLLLRSHVCRRVWSFGRLLNPKSQTRFLVNNYTYTNTYTTHRRVVVGVGKSTWIMQNSIGTRQ